MACVVCVLYTQQILCNDVVFKSSLFNKCQRPSAGIATRKRTLPEEELGSTGVRIRVLVRHLVELPGQHWGPAKELQKSAHRIKIRYLRTSVCTYDANIRIRMLVDKG